MAGFSSLFIGSERLAASLLHMTLLTGGMGVVWPRLPWRMPICRPVSRRPVALLAAQAPDAKRLVVALPTLAAGTYTVLWRVTSIDTHRSEGQFVFIIRQS